MKMAGGDIYDVGVWYSNSLCVLFLSRCHNTRCTAAVVESVTSRPLKAWALASEAWLEKETLIEEKRKGKNLKISFFFFKL